MGLLTVATQTGFILRIDDSVSFTGTTEIPVLSYIVQGKALTMTNEMRFNFYFSLSTAALLPGTLTIRIKYGSLVLTLGTGALALTGGAANAPFRVSGTLSNKTTTSAQFLEGEIAQQTGGLSLGSAINQAFVRGTVDSTVNQTWAITAQFSNAIASNVLVLERAKAELS